VYDTKPWLLKTWVPIVWFSIASLVVAVEIRLVYGFATNK
jgi:hypothetical protein